MDKINLRIYAHLGDAIWELFVREIVVDACNKPKELHQETIKYVNAGFQAEILELPELELSNEEQEIKRRARNMPVPVSRRSNQNEYRLATAFEALLGYWSRNNKERLEEVLNILREKIK